MEKETVDFINSVPQEYKVSLYYVIKYAQICFGNNLYNLTLGGSLGKNNVIRGWSDIDLYVILEDYNVEEVVEFSKYINELDIHVGTTYYTLCELEEKMIDSKTKVMLYEKQNYNVNPTLYGINVFKEVTYDEIVMNDWNNLPNILHDFRRRYIELISSSENKVTKVYIKKLFVLIKCVLNCYGIFSYGYDYSLEQLKSLAEITGYDLTPIKGFDIISLINNMDNAKENILEFSIFLLNFVEFSYKNMRGDKKWIRELVREQ